MKNKYLSVAMFLLYCVYNFGCNSHAGTAPIQEKHEYSLAKNDDKNLDAAKMQFIDSVTFSFGDIRVGSEITHSFRFKNTGKTPLIIKSAFATCGCTVASFNKRPILPGEIDSVVAVFKTHKGSLGFQNKVITISYNSPKSPIMLTVYGRVR